MKTQSGPNGSTWIHRPQKYFCAYASGTTPVVFVSSSKVSGFREL